MPHAIELKDGKILTPFGIRDLLDAVQDYAGEELRREIESYISSTSRTRSTLHLWNRSRASPSCSAKKLIRM